MREKRYPQGLRVGSIPCRPLLNTLKLLIAMRSCFLLPCLVIGILFIPASVFNQTTNFDETWKEFLENNKISNMIELVKPDKVLDKPDYARYLLMNTNTSFCQSEVDEAEELMAEIQEMDPMIHESIEGFVEKRVDLETKIKAYHTMDAIWQRFLQTKEVDPEELEAVTAAKTICEKTTLAKYSYMTAYYHFCQGNVPRSRDIFENRTLKLAEKTSLRVEDVEGLAEEVARMKSMYRDMSQLDIAWKTYVETGVSPGFDIEMPLFACNPIPKMKELLLKGAVDLCQAGPDALEQIKKLQAGSGVAPDRDLRDKLKGLEAAVAENEARLSVLNEAWEAFIPDNKVKHLGKYGYEYCSKEPLIRAYIMDGFGYGCAMAEEMLLKIDSLQSREVTPLEEITMIKINELAELTEEYRANGVEIERLWNKFIAQRDTLFGHIPSTDEYCDNIQQVKDWTINGLCGSCEDGIQYLEQIEGFQRTFDFKFSKEVECRVQKLRIKIWDCRYQALRELARVGSTPETRQQKLDELIEEYGIGERPEVCSPD